MKKQNLMKSILCAAIFAAGAMQLQATNVLGRITCEGKAIAGVAVSDGDTIVYSGPDGRYSMESSKALCTIFITTPSGYRAHGTDPMRPGFWQYMNLEPGQDEIHDFELVREDQSHYTVAFLPDLHFVNEERRDDINRFKTMCYPRIKEGIDAAAAKGAVYTVDLGDFTHDVYWYENNFNEADGMRLLQDLGYPTPIYGVMGNHDHDGAIVGENVDFRAAWRYRNVWGPDRYSVNLGNDHWVFLDNMYYINVEGKGKKAPGINGDRSYSNRLTDSQMAWLNKDLQTVSPDTRVYICCHCPIIQKKKKPATLIEEQVKAIDEMAARFKEGITIYSGHIHRWDLCETAVYPNLHQMSYPAASGIMWETLPEYPLCSSDGSDAGVMFASYEKGAGANYDFLTYTGGNSMLRVYDMNSVGKAYRENELCRKQHQMYPTTRLWYADKKYRNYVYVNFWEEFPGDRLEVSENGFVLADEGRYDEDPLKNFAYELQMLDNSVKHHHAHESDSCRSMHEYKTSSSKTPITVRVYDKNGKLKFEKTYARPLPFNPKAGTAEQGM